MADNNNAKRLFCTLEILKKHSDADHRLGQQDIIKLLWDLYEIKADRKTIKSNILNLIDLGYEINYTKTVRNAGKPDENEIWSDYYMDNEFDDSELRLLIDSVLYSPNISPCQSKQLIKKLENQSSEYFKSRIKHIANMPSRKSENKQLFHTIDIIDEAISKKRRIAFKNIYYGPDLKLHVARAFLDSKDKISENEFIVTPYQMVINDGIYYLICRHIDKRLIHIRLDNIIDVRMLDKKALSLKDDINPEDEPLNLRRYLQDHIFMKSGTPIRARLKVVSLFFTEITNVFGRDVTVISSDKHSIDVEVKAPEAAIYQFALSHTGTITVTEPAKLANDIMTTLKCGYKRYERELNKKKDTEE